MNNLRKIRKIIADGRVANVVLNRLRPYVIGTRSLFFSASKGRVKLHVPAPVDPKSVDDPIARRVFKALKKAKVEQSDCPSIFLASEAWQATLDDGFAPVLQAIEENDVNKFNKFLANFGSCVRSLGFEVRPHSSLGYIPPALYCKTSGMILFNFSHKTWYKSKESLIYSRNLR